MSIYNCREGVLSHKVDSGEFLVLPFREQIHGSNVSHASKMAPPNESRQPMINLVVLKLTTL